MIDLEHHFFCMQTSLVTELCLEPWLKGPFCPSLFRRIKGNLKHLKQAVSIPSYSIATQLACTRPWRPAMNK